MQKRKNEQRVSEGCSLRKRHEMRIHARQPTWLCIVLVLSATEATHGQQVFEPPMDGARKRLEAQRADGDIRIDGRLDEADWSRAPLASGFIQSEPDQGAAARFATEVRVLYDEQFLYVGAILHDSTGAQGPRARDLRRDFDDAQNDVFGVHVDPFLDGRSATAFVTNPYGAQRDLQSLDDQGRLLGLEWDGIWHVRTQVDDAHWTAEMAIPWATLRYPADAQEWAINFVRIARRANEVSGWSPWPRAYSALRMTYAGRLGGFDPPPPAMNLRIQPYGVVRLDRVRPGLPAAAPRSDVEPRVGADLKWAPGPNTVVDLTANTDFAQADADVQQINLNRFSVFFPEKRSFFLESANLLTLGLGSWGEPFFSRRIGLDESGAPVGLDGGVRTIHRTPERSFGALAVRQRAQDDSPASYFGVTRWIENLGDENRVGGMVVGRFDEARDTVETAQNVVALIDGFVRPTRSSYVRAALARSLTSGVGGEGTGAWFHAAMNNNRGYFGWIQAHYGAGYEPRAGFLPRPDIILTSPAVTLDFRPSWRPSFIRSFNPGFTSAFYHRASDRRFQEGYVTIYPFTTTFSNGAYIRPYIQPQWQALQQDFLPVPGLRVPAGDYTFTDFGITYRDDLSRWLWWWVTVGTGPYFDGRRDQLIYRMRVAPDPRLALTIDYVGNRITGIGPDNDRSTTHLWYPELRVGLDPRLTAVALFQYNSVTRASSWNARLAWEIRPLSYLYLVFNDRTYRDPITGSTEPVPAERQLIVKLSYVFRL